MISVVILELLVLPAIVLSEMTEEAKSQILQLHNDHRSKLGASNMFKLQWDADLAQASEDWANACVYEHKGRGENLAWNKPASPMSTKELIADAFQGWYDEKNDHSYGSGQCYTTNSCHYTQLAWHDTSKIGCAYKKCPYLTNAAQDAWWIVCNYSPWGNDMGVNVFEIGTACSHEDCEGLPCENDLCVGEKQMKCVDNEVACPEWSKNKQCATNPDYMKKSCRMSCGVCTPTAEEKITGKEKGECKDMSSHCTSWAQRGDCISYKTKMVATCPKSCNFCGSDIMCIDENTNCEKWSKSNQCESNPNYMKYHCRKSCKQC